MRTTAASHQGANQNVLVTTLWGSLTLVISVGARWEELYLCSLQRRLLQTTVSPGEHQHPGNPGASCKGGLGVESGDSLQQAEDDFWTGLNWECLSLELLEET